MGEDPPQKDPLHNLAIKAWNLLGNGMGGVDWAGFPYVVELLGVQDPEQLMGHLLHIKAYRPPEDNDET